MSNVTEFYNPLKMLSYNAYLNFVIGGRGIGKTFSLKVHLAKRFLKYGEQFIYLRRNKTELDRIDKDNFLTDEMLQQIFKGFNKKNVETTKNTTRIIFDYKDKTDNVLTLTNSKIVLNGNVMCYFKSLSTWVDLKGSEYDSVYSILFDEVLIDMSSRKNYLKNEVEALLNFIFSVFRRRENCHVYLLSNASNFNNPYFNYLKIENSEKRFQYLKDYDTLIEFPPNKPFDENKENTNGFFKLIKNSSIYGSVVNNNFQEKAIGNIGKIKQNKKPLIVLECDSRLLTVYNVDDKIYIDDSVDKNSKIFTFNINMVDKNYTYLGRSSKIVTTLKKNIYENNVYYSSLDVKFLFNNTIEKYL